jgi:hypothetical protein
MGGRTQLLLSQANHGSAAEMKGRQTAWQPMRTCAVTVGILLVAGILLNGWYRVDLEFDCYRVGAVAGRIRLGIMECEPQPVSFEIYKGFAVWRWWPATWHGLVGVSGKGGVVPARSVHVPLWFLLVPVCALAGIAWRHCPRGVGPGCCATCAYNLTGNVSGICPECGTPVPPSAESKPKESS